MAVSTTRRTTGAGMAKPTPDEVPRTREDEAVHPDQVTVHVDEGAAGIARIDRRVGLDVGAGVAVRVGGAVERRDDAVGDSLADAEGIADRQDQIADLAVGALVDHQSWELLAGRDVDLQDRQVGPRVGQHDAGGKLAPVGQRDSDLGAAFDHVIVGDDDAVGPHDHAGPQRPLDTVARCAQAEQLPEGIDLLADHPLGRDIHHRRGCAPDDGGEGLFHAEGAGRRHARRRLGVGGHGRGKGDEGWDQDAMGVHGLSSEPNERHFAGFFGRKDGAYGLNERRTIRLPPSRRRPARGRPGPPAGRRRPGGRRR
jgi:hypothetical protein